MKTMTKYQLEHFKNKVNRQFHPYIQEQELIVKQYKTEAIDQAVQQLSKKMGADKVLEKLKQAEKNLLEVRATARTFFEKKKPKDGELNYSLQREERSSGLTVEDCEEQLRDWATSLAEREIERRPEGRKLKQLKDTKQQAIDTVMEAGCPQDLIVSLGQVSKCIGLTWSTDLKQISSE